MYQDGQRLIQTFKGGRVYPHGPGISLNYNQDLFLGTLEFEQSPYLWALKAFFLDDSEIGSDFERRILNSLRWYRKSISLFSSPEEAILHLAVGLESLLDLDAGEGITVRFKETIRVLLGSPARLESWAEQFYQARSKIVHRGAWENLRFRPYESGKGSKDADKFSQTHGSLLEYGWRIFRMCLNTIVSGALLAHNSKLQSLFVPNAERLVNIKKKLEEKSDASVRLSSIAQDVLDLQSYFYAQEDQPDIGLLIAVARRMAALIGTFPQDVPPTVMKDLAEFGGEHSDLDASLERLGNLTVDLNKWRDEKYRAHVASPRERLRQVKEDPVLILVEFFDFVSQPAIRIQRIEAKLLSDLSTD